MVLIYWRIPCKAIINACVRLHNFCVDGWLHVTGRGGNDELLPERVTRIEATAAGRAVADDEDMDDERLEALVANLLNGNHIGLRGAKCTRREELTHRLSNAGFGIHPDRGLL